MIMRKAATNRVARQKKRNERKLTDNRLPAARRTHLTASLGYGFRLSLNQKARLRGLFDYLGRGFTGQVTQRLLTMNY